MRERDKKKRRSVRQPEQREKAGREGQRQEGGARCSKTLDQSPSARICCIQDKSRLSRGVAHMHAFAKGILQLQLYQNKLIVSGHLLFTFRITEQLDIFSFSLNFGPNFRFNFVHLFTHYFYFL